MSILRAVATTNINTRSYLSQTSRHKSILRYQLGHKPMCRKRNMLRYPR